MRNLRKPKGISQRVEREGPQRFQRRSLREPKRGAYLQNLA
jgi:hypothetical protein